VAAVLERRPNVGDRLRIVKVVNLERCPSDRGSPLILMTVRLLIANITPTPILARGLTAALPYVQGRPRLPDLVSVAADIAVARAFSRPFGDHRGAQDRQYLWRDLQLGAHLG
jgi:hypothetical protein